MATNPPPQKIHLIPWDAVSPEHRERMVEQRIACGWRAEEVEEWAEKVQKGIKCLYWIILADDLSDREAMIATHLARYPKESTPITDTALKYWTQPRTPTSKSFLPIGHIALDKRPEANVRFGLVSSPPSSSHPSNEEKEREETFIWVASLYVSWALHSRGLGRAAMRAVEAAAAAAPVHATVAVLDTVAGAFQMSEASREEFHRVHGVPMVEVSNEDWYRRQGYKDFHTDDKGYVWPNPYTGEKVIVPIIYFKKPLVVAATS